MRPSFVVVPIPRGPSDPPPLGSHVVYVAESQKPWWAISAAGDVIALCYSNDAAQSALAGRKVSNG